MAPLSHSPAAVQLPASAPSACVQRDRIVLLRQCKFGSLDVNVVYAIATSTCTAEGTPLISV